ncbi:MAG: hypothetical protein AB7S44_01440 [Spirochaetales bacterium]
MKTVKKSVAIWLMVVLLILGLAYVGVFDPSNFQVNTAFVIFFYGGIFVPLILAIIIMSTNKLAGIKTYFIIESVLVFFAIFTTVTDTNMPFAYIAMYQIVAFIVASILFGLSKKERISANNNRVRKPVSQKSVMYTLLAVTSLFLISIVLPFYAGSGEIMGIQFDASVSIIDLDSPIYAIVVALPILAFFFAVVFAKMKKEALTIMNIFALVIYLAIFYWLTEFDFDFAGIGTYIYILGYFLLVLSTIFSFKLPEDATYDYTPQSQNMNGAPTYDNTRNYTNSSPNGTTTSGKDIEW